MLRRVERLRRRRRVHLRIRRLVAPRHVRGEHAARPTTPRVPPQTLKLKPPLPPLQSLFVGYLQWDLCWVIYHHHAAHDWGSIIHHGMFTVMTHYVLHGWFFKKP